jgi:hypothetical protein
MGVWQSSVVEVSIHLLWSLGSSVRPLMMYRRFLVESEGVREAFECRYATARAAGHMVEHKSLRAWSEAMLLTSENILIVEGGTSVRAGGRKGTGNDFLHSALVQ